ncbi:hypothetical protein BKA61DRAFT_96454 [Leptodontidium sp. MPI-SDFR-AT-0119]|nr:hypothetical protein BKA61DRAFT_96454 [Leptodontidium sp. MPI-SDFR-AT-0119]
MQRHSLSHLLSSIALEMLAHLHFPVYPHRPQLQRRGYVLNPTFLDSVYLYPFFISLYLLTHPISIIIILTTLSKLKIPNISPWRRIFRRSRYRRGNEQRWDLAIVERREDRETHLFFVFLLLGLGAGAQVVCPRVIHYVERFWGVWGFMVVGLGEDVLGV